jgi:hypothetical protein
MEQQLYMLKLTSGNHPFPNTIPRYIQEKVDRYTGYLQATDIQNRELEVRLIGSLHNAEVDQRQQEAAMMAARDKVQLFQDIGKLGLHDPSLDLNELTPFSSEGMAHLDSVARRKYNSSFGEMVQGLRNNEEEAEPMRQHDSDVWDRVVRRSGWPI